MNVKPTARVNKDAVIADLRDLVDKLLERIQVLERELSEK